MWGKVSRIPSRRQESECEVRQGEGRIQAYHRRKRAPCHACQAARRARRALHGHKGPRRLSFVYPDAEWASLEARIRSLGNGEKARRIKRYYCANAFDAQLDAQGRILIPGNLREFACLEKDVTVVGLLDHAEIWDTEKWNEYNGSIDAESISADMEGIDF